MLIAETATLVALLILVSIFQILRDWLRGVQMVPHLPFSANQVKGESSINTKNGA
jgi:hypothetical protein